MAKKFKCKACGAEFEKTYSTTQKVCNWQCAKKFGQEKVARQIAKTDRRLQREAKERLKTKSDWLKEAQYQFNKFVRLRDRFEPCISCGTYTAKWDAGHYKSVGAYPELRFDEQNCHKQCARCNNQKSGNIIEYRKMLIKKIGEDALNRIEGPTEPQHLNIEQIKAIKEKYRKKARELQQNL
jgi:hypothetical protein